MAWFFLTLWRFNICTLWKYHTVTQCHSGLGTFSILLAGNNEIKILNKKFRGKNKTTDVLSFPYHEAFELKKNKNTNVYLGDVILNYNKINKKNFKKDFNKLWVHGFLHLIGYTHKKDKDYYKMSNIEKKILNKIKN